MMFASVVPFICIGVILSTDGMCACEPTSVMHNSDPIFVSRSEWGARPPKTPPSPLELPVNMTFIHHSAGKWECDTLETCIQQVRSIQDFHMDDRGWNDIGYSFLIGGDGRVYEGRGWGAVGAHTLGYNNVALGFCFIGNFNSTLPDQRALTAAKQAIEFGVNKDYITNNYELFGHRDGRCKTDCPGNDLYDLIQTWPHYSRRTIHKFC